MRELKYKTPFMVLALSFVLTIPLTFQSEVSRSPSSLKEIADIFQMRGNMFDKVKYLDRYIDEEFFAYNCGESLELPIRRIKVEHLGINEVKLVKKKPQLIQDIWKTRQKLLSKFKSFHSEKGFHGESCIKQIKTLNYELRYAEDYLGSHVFHTRQKLDKGEAVTFSGVYPNLISNNEEFEWKKSLKSGDILITKGNFFFSGSLAKIGVQDTHFSHQGIIYKDHERDNQFFAAEAHPEVGATVRPLSVMNNNDRNVRTLVMRFKDEALSDRAGKYGYDLVKKASDSGVNIPYDFWMNFDEEEYIFCSELVTIAFDKASDGQVMFPMYPTEIELKKSNFAKKLGIESQQALHPGDLEYDPTVETVVEWRDYSRIMENLVKDEILHKLYEWMEIEGYELKNSAIATIHESVTYHVRKWPVFGKILEHEFPTHMPQEYIGTVVTLQAVGQPLLDHLMKENEKHFEKRGRYLTRKEMHEVLEDYRKKDRKLWERYLKVKSSPKKFRESFRRNGNLPLFHLIFNNKI